MIPRQLLCGRWGLLGVACISVFLLLSPADVLADCSAGNYQVDIDGQTGCNVCQKGKFKEGTNSLTTCTECAAGKFAQDTGNDVCDLCPMGKHQPATGETECIDCWYGQYAAHDGQSSCSVCAAGRADNTTTGKDRNIACAACLPGRFTAVNARAVCQFCPAGKYSEFGATSCIDCDSGKTNNRTGSAACWAGTLAACPFTDVQDVGLYAPTNPCLDGQYRNSDRDSSCIDTWRTSPSARCIDKVRQFCDSAGGEDNAGCQSDNELVQEWLGRAPQLMDSGNDIRMTAEGGRAFAIEFDRATDMAGMTKDSDTYEKCATLLDSDTLANIDNDGEGDDNPGAKCVWVSSRKLHIVTGRNTKYPHKTNDKLVIKAGVIRAKDAPTDTAVANAKMSIKVDVDNGPSVQGGIGAPQVVGKCSGWQATAQLSGRGHMWASLNWTLDTANSTGLDADATAVIELRLTEWSVGQHQKVKFAPSDVPEGAFVRLSLRVVNRWNGEKTLHTQFEKTSTDIPSIDIPGPLHKDADHYQRLRIPAFAHPGDCGNYASKRLKYKWSFVTAQPTADDSKAYKTFVKLERFLSSNDISNIESCASTNTACRWKLDGPELLGENGQWREDIMYGFKLTVTRADADGETFDSANSATAFVFVRKRAGKKATLVLNSAYRRIHSVSQPLSISAFGSRRPTSSSSLNYKWSCWSHVLHKPCMLDMTCTLANSGNRCCDGKICMDRDALHLPANALDFNDTMVRISVTASFNGDNFVNDPSIATDFVDFKLINTPAPIVDVVRVPGDMHTASNSLELRMRKDTLTPKIADADSDVVVKSPIAKLKWECITRNFDMNDPTNFVGGDVLSADFLTSRRSLRIRDNRLMPNTDYQFRLNAWMAEETTTATTTSRRLLADEGLDLTSFTTVATAGVSEILSAATTALTLHTIPSSAEVKFTTAKSLQAGTCSISPDSGVAGDTVFTIDCKSDWEGESADHFISFAVDAPDSRSQFGGQSNGQGNGLRKSSLLVKWTHQRTFRTVLPPGGGRIIVYGRNDQTGAQGSVTLTVTLTQPDGIDTTAGINTYVSGKLDDLKTARLNGDLTSFRTLVATTTSLLQRAGVPGADNEVSTLTSDELAERKTSRAELMSNIKQFFRPTGSEELSADEIDSQFDMLTQVSNQPKEMSKATMTELASELKDSASRMQNLNSLYQSCIDPQSSSTDECEEIDVEELGGRAMESLGNVMRGQRDQFLDAVKSGDTGSFTATDAQELADTMQRTMRSISLSLMQGVTSEDTETKYASSTTMRLGARKFAVADFVASEITAALNNTALDNANCTAAGIDSETGLVCWRPRLGKVQPKFRLPATVLSKLQTAATGDFQAVMQVFGDNPYTFLEVGGIDRTASEIVELVLYDNSDNVLAITGLDDPIDIDIPAHTALASGQKYRCRWLAEGATSTGTGGTTTSWSIEGCETIMNGEADVICRCTHLTSFSLEIISSSSSSSSDGMIIGIVCGCIAAVGIIVAIVVVYLRKKKADGGESGAMNQVTPAPDADVEEGKALVPNATDAATEDAAAE